MRILALLFCSIIIQTNVLAQAQASYHALNAGHYAGPAVPASPDPLVNFRWNDPRAADPLQLYTLQPRKIDGKPGSSFHETEQAITVTGKGELMFDFGVESAGWLEFESDDLVDSIEASISEYNLPAIVNQGAQHPVKTAIPQKSGNTYRLQLNNELYEGVRFAWIHVKTFTREWRIRNIRLVCQVKPTNYNGSFYCNDTMLNRIWYTGAYVVKLNILKDHFGAILMERSDRHSWTGDAYPAQAASLVAFGNYDMVRTNLAFTAEQDNGIPAYSIYWVLSLIDYYNYSGDAAFFKQYAQYAHKRLQQAYATYDSLPDLGFMGWDERLGAGFEQPQIREAQNAYRMLCINAWKQFSKAMLSVNETVFAEKYQGYADAKIAQLYKTPGATGNYGVHALSEAINAGLLNDPAITQRSATLYADKLNRLSYSPFNQYFIIQAMALAGKYNEASETIADCWGGQIRYGGTTFFEVYRPSWNTILKTNDAPPNNQCGYTSLAHPWGAGVTKWLSENVLGIQPVTPGFKRFNIIPHLTGDLTRVKGAMPTSSGNIEAAFNTENGVIELMIPTGTTAEKVGIPKPNAGKVIGEVIVNNKVYYKHAAVILEDADFIYLKNLKADKYTIHVVYSGTNKTSGAVPQTFQYAIDNFQQDSTTSGNWKGKYGKDGFFLLGQDIKSTPAYVKAISVNRNATVTWAAATSDKRALEQPGTNTRQASAIITKDPIATLQTMTIDVTLKEDHPFQLSLYFLDWDNKNRKTAIEIFDLKTLNIIAPVQMVEHYEQGKYISFPVDRPIRIRINQVRGENAAVSGVFFDKNTSAL